MRAKLAMLLTTAALCACSSSIGTTGRTDGECPASVPKTEDGCDVGAKICTYCPGSAQCTCFDHSWRCNSFSCADAGR